MMRLFPVALALACFAAPAWSQQVAEPSRGGGVAVLQSSATVWGQVRSERTGAPLRFAVIELVAGGASSLAAITDSTGFYVLRDVPSGRRLLRASHIDHAPNEIEILVLSEKQHVIDFDLEFRPLRLSAVMAQGARGLPVSLDTMAARESELGPATVRVLESSPGVAELGLAEAAREVPGEPVDPSDVLYVRGGSSDLKLVLLNGAPVYAPFHLGGLIHALDTDVLRSAHLHVGGAPARYDGGLSYIMDLQTRSGRNQVPKAKLGLDMMSARTLLEGPAGDRGSVLLSARAVHGVGTREWLQNDFPYEYGDALGRVDVVVGHGHVLTLTGFWNQERVRLDTVGAARQVASWGNQAGSLRYRGRVLDTEVLGTLALGYFQTLLPLGGIRPLVTEGTAARTRLLLDMERPFDGGRMFFGASAERIDFDHRAFRQGGSRDSALVNSHADGAVIGAYGEAAMTVLPRVRVRGGLRADLFTRAGGVRLAPRASATVLLTDRAALTLSGGQYRQYVRAPDRSLVSLGSIIPDSAAGATLSVAEASHVVLSLSQDFGEGIRLGLDGYFKQFDGLQTSRAHRTESSGVDLWVRRNTGSLTGWLGYSLAWVWVVQRGDAPRTGQDFSGRHLISAGIVGPTLGQGQFDVRFSYGAGLPYTAIPEPEVGAPVFGAQGFAKLETGAGAPTDGPKLPTAPQEPYIRLDAQLSHVFNGSVRDFDFQFTPYLRVINALNRRDAIFYHFDRDAGEAQPLADLPVVPILGLEWKF